jgi:hypothetical protein
MDLSARENFSRSYIPYLNHPGGALSEFNLLETLRNSHAIL